MKMDVPGSKGRQDLVNDKRPSIDSVLTCNHTLDEYGSEFGSLMNDKTGKYEIRKNIFLRSLGVSRGTVDDNCF